MDMIERVARAIAAANGDDWGREGEAGLLEGYAPLARAAIEAMREPPADFLTFAAHSHDLRPQDWAELIDAAMKD